MVKRRAQQCAILWVWVLGISVTGCNLLKNDQEPEHEIHLDTLSISLDADANEYSATAIDLLVVYKKSLLRTLSKTSARKYFDNREQFFKDYPDMVDVWHWELTPGQRIVDFQIPFREDSPEGAFIFCNYYAPGEHRIRIGPHEDIHIRLMRKSFCVVEQGCPGVQLPESDTVSGNIKGSLDIPLFQEAPPPRMPLKKPPVPPIDLDAEAGDEI